jgi:hypothetical protein
MTTGRQEQIGVAVSPWGKVSVSYTDDSNSNGSDQIRLGLGAVNSTFILRAAAPCCAWTCRPGRCPPELSRAR